MPILTRVLLRVFLLLLFAGGILFVVYDYQVTSDLADRLQEEQVQAGKRQAQQFSEEVRRTLERYQFKDLIDRSRGELLKFEKFSETVLNASEYISYFHWKNDRGETLLFKGPDSLQKFIINETGVTYLQSTTSEVREVRVERPGRIDKLTDITTPILTNDRRLGSISVGIDQTKIRAHAEAASRRVRTRTIVYSGAGIALVGLVFLYVTALMRKVGRLSLHLEHQSRMAYVGTLASGLVHEIRNPLNGISLNLALLEDEARESSDPAIASTFGRVIGRIRPNLDHLEHISHEFLMFAKPPQLKLSLVKLSDVVSETMLFLTPQLESAKVAADVDCPGDLPEAMLDREKIGQVLVNLAVNAIQAMPRGGRLAVRVRRAGRELALTVGDTGCGITAENQKKLFSLFFSTKQHGVGLGLPIVKRLVEDHGGTIVVSSTEGSGTSFEVRLPIARSPESAETGGPEILDDELGRVGLKID